MDPAAPASIIAAIASPAETVCTGLNKRTAKPRRRRRPGPCGSPQDQGQAAAPAHVAEVVVIETIPAAAGQEGAKASQLLSSRGFPVRNLQPVRLNPRLTG